MNNCFAFNLSYKTNRLYIVVGLFSLMGLCVPLLCSYHILMSSVIYYLADAWQHGILLLGDQRKKWFFFVLFWFFFFLMVSSPTDLKEITSLWIVTNEW